MSPEAFKLWKQSHASQSPPNASRNGDFGHCHTCNWGLPVAPDVLSILTPEIREPPEDFSGKFRFSRYGEAGGLTRKVGTEL